MLRSISAACVALMLVLAVAAVAAGPVRASQDTANETVILELINHARAQRGLAPLYVHAALSRAALAHSRDMMRHHYFSHSSQSGATCAVRTRRAGYVTSGCRSWAVSEVIGWGMSSVGTPQAIFNAWMRSSYHRSVILGRRWRDVGVGCVSGTFQGAPGSWMYTVDMGRRIK
ncbi:MAG: CAP domain-containing protein [Actinobacteria bacterium]|nr:CAP domain-containing protein [Actinomycetota bacterium]